MNREEEPVKALRKATTHRKARWIINSRIPKRSAYPYLSLSYAWFVGCLFGLINSGGCADNGIELQLRLPTEPSKDLHLEITIDKKLGVSPRKIAPGVYAIEFSESGDAVINSPWVLNQWRKPFVVTPTKKLAMFEGFQTVKSGWKLASTTEKLAGGGVRSTSTVQGSKYWMDLEIKDPVVPELSAEKPKPK